MIVFVIGITLQSYFGSAPLLSPILVLLIVAGTITLGSRVGPILVAVVLAVGILSGSWVPAVVEALAAATAVRACGLVWGGSTRPSDWSRAAIKYLFAVIVTVGVFVVVKAWLYELFGLASFSIIVIYGLKTVLPVSVAGFVIVILSTTPEENTSPDLLSPTGLSISVIVVAWVLIGYAINFVFRTFATVAPNRIESRLMSFITLIIEVSGPSGQYIVSAFGFVAFVLLLWVLLHGGFPQIKPVRGYLRE